MQREWIDAGGRAVAGWRELLPTQRWRAGGGLADACSGDGPAEL